MMRILFVVATSLAVFFGTLLWIQICLTIVFGFIKNVLAFNIITRMSMLDKLEEKFGKGSVPPGFSQTFH